MRFAGCDDPVHFLWSAGGGAQRFLRRFRRKRQLIFVFGNVSERFDAGALAKFAHWHSKRAIDFLRRNDARTSRGRRGNDRNLVRVCRLSLLLSWSPLGH